MFKTQPNPFPEATNLLMPFMNTVDERELWLTQAFYLSEPRLYSQIDRGGDPLAFTVRLLKTLIKFGCISDNEHSASLLLRTLRYAVGREVQATIDKLVTDFNVLCVESSKIIHPTIIDRPKLTATTQTVNTLIQQRSPSVFVSYSHSDRQLALRLITDIQSAGHSCWIDNAEIKGGDAWIEAITEGINNSYAFITMLSNEANSSPWVRREFLWAEMKQKPIFPILAQECEIPIYVVERQVIPLYLNYAEKLHELINTLPSPRIDTQELDSDPTEGGRVVQIPSQAPDKKQQNRRVLELDYIERVNLEELINAEKYTPIPGRSVVVAKNLTSGDLVVPRPEFSLTPWVGNQAQRSTIHRFEDAVSEIMAIKRAVVLGEPGSGKTSTLWSLAKTLAEAASKNIDSPIPLLLKLGKWINPSESFRDFAVREIGELGEYFDALLSEKRAALLLDGLNEIPKEQQLNKHRQIQKIITLNNMLITVVTCREYDYDVELGIDRITVMPLNPPRIRDFINNYLPLNNDELFWKLTGDELLRDVWGKWESVGSSFDLFWTAKEIPNSNPNVNSVTSKSDDELWRRRVLNPSNLLVLAQNPYMLLMLTRVYSEIGDLPLNRGELFRNFVETLLIREKVTERDLVTYRAVITDKVKILLSHLSELAYKMQLHYGQADKASVLTAMPLTEANEIITEEYIRLALNANLLDVSSEIRFTHQLLQEYFAATHIAAEIKDSGLQASSIWKSDNWWERTSWEETVILLTGLYSDDSTEIIEWVAKGNPEVAAQCIQYSGAHTPHNTLLRLQENWLPRLYDVEKDIDPKARAAIGRALGLINIDNRKGIGLTVDKIPDIDWVIIPKGSFIYQDSIELLLPAFYISRYPITYLQFQSFIDANDGYRNPAWWSGLATRDREPGEQRFLYWNHPRDNVSWYDAMAFCRWLSFKLGFTIRLPTEQEWEKSAQGTEGSMYSYGKTYDPTRCNTSATQIKQTTAVGIFPHGTSSYGIHDLNGNVWEWCLNTYEEPFEKKVLRGGSWEEKAETSTSLFRFDYAPSGRYPDFGFRILREIPENGL